MLTTIQSLLIATPILWVTLGIVMLSRTRVIIEGSPPPLWVRVQAYGTVIFISPAILLHTAGKDNILKISEKEDE